MSLRVWLPLNGNLNNQGASGCNPVQSTAPTYVNGKIGKAMSTGAFYLPAAEVAKFYNNNAMSWCFQIYPTGSGGNAILGQQNMAAGNNRMFTIFQYPNPVDLHLSWQGEAQNNATFLSTIISNAFTINVQNHCAITYNGTTALMYVNGTLIGSATGTSPRTNFSYDVPLPSASNRYLCDFRIYDHVLSPKEIKEISKGLVLHYPMTGGGSSAPNILKNTNTANTDLFGYSEAVGGSSKIIEYDGGTPCIKVTRNTTEHSSQDYMQHNSLDHAAIKVSTTYTLSFDAIASGSGTVGFSGFMNGNATNQLSQSTETIQGNFNANNQSHLVFRTTTKSSFDGLTVGGQVVYMSCPFMRTTGVQIKVKNFKVEEGSTATSQIPYASDAAYTSMGLNTNQEKDTSGYGYDGTKSGTLSLVSNNTSRYDSCLDFNKSGYIIKDPFNVTVNAFTLNFQVNLKAMSSQHFIFGTFSSQTNHGIGLQRDTGTPTKYSCLIKSDSESTYSNQGITGITTGIQNMITLVYNGTTYKGYLNNNQVFSVTYGSNGTITNPNFMVGNSKYNGTPASENEEAFISDVRFYATALSVDDIKELYQTSASITNNGSVMCLDFQEN